MVYSIVQTEESYGFCLSTVPSSWIEGGYLLWPPSHISQLRKNPKSVPEDFWQKHQCVVKRADIQSLKEALQLEKELSIYSDYEDEALNQVRKQNARKHPVSVITENSVDYNSFMQALKGSRSTITKGDDKEIFTTVQTNCFDVTTSDSLQLPKTYSNASGSSSLSVMSSSSASHYSVSIDANNATSFIEKDHNSTKEPTTIADMPIIEIGDVNSSLTLVNNDRLCKIEETLNNLVLSVVNCTSSVDALTMAVEKLMYALNSANKPGIQPDAIEINDEFQRLLNFLPIATKDGLDEMEITFIKDHSFGNLFVNYFATFYGTSGKKDAKKIMYPLFDRIFNKDFVCLCSWTGATKMKNKLKIQFSKYTSFMEYFDKVLRLADSRHCSSDTTDFIKLVLKNSRKRLIMGQHLKSKENIEANEKLDILLEDTAVEEHLECIIETDNNAILDSNVY